MKFWFMLRKLIMKFFDLENKLILWSKAFPVSLAVDVYHSKRHIKTFIEGLLIDDEYERVRD